jgi:hypothetical protein
MTDRTYDEAGRVGIPDLPGWRYLPFQGDGDERTVTLVRDADGLELRFTVPAIVLRGAELGAIASLVVAAQDRIERSEGLGA